VIEVRNLVVERSGRRALGPLTGSFGCGALVLAGPAQSGKTTLLKALCGLAPASAGSVEVDGAPLGPRSSPRFGMVFQSDALFDSMDALGNVGLPLLRRGVPRAEARERAREALAQVGLSGQERALPERLSGGMRKRLGIARAIVARPRYLLADEPLAGLDPGTCERVLRLLFALWGRAGGLIIASAEPAPFLEVCDEVLILRGGCAAARGAPPALRADPGTRALLGGEAAA
jgi:phospholipid/cholesterol/gamma-HCH transport system ATP-binding protein